MIGQRIRLKHLTFILRYTIINILRSQTNRNVCGSGNQQRPKISRAGCEKNWRITMTTETQRTEIETRQLTTRVEILFYYDRPLLDEWQDQDGRRYLCDWERLEEEENGLRIFVIPISDEQKQALNKGTVDLLSVMLESARKDGWYISLPQRDFRMPIVIEKQEEPLEDRPDLLPNEGLTLKGMWDD